MPDKDGSSILSYWDVSDDDAHVFVPTDCTNDAKQAFIDVVGTPGQLLCFLRADNVEPVFGILANDVAEARVYGTCLMLDGKYRAFSCHVLGEAVGRCIQKKYAALCPRIELMRLLLQRNQNRRALKIDILKVETKYEKRIRRATTALKVGTIPTVEKGLLHSDVTRAPSPVEKDIEPSDVFRTSSPVEKGIKPSDVSVAADPV